MKTAQSLIDLLHANSSEEHAEKFRRYFKSDDISEDWFLGLSMPAIRDCIKEFKELPLSEIEILLDSNYHEIRMAGLLLLVKKSNKKTREEIAQFFLRHTYAINAWDLVDASACEVLGMYLVEHKKEDLLEGLLAGTSRWEKRIAIVSCFAFIKKGNMGIPLLTSLKLAPDTEDLVIKANGWLLRHGIKKGFKPDVINHLQKNKNLYTKKVIQIALQDLPAEERKL